jgi:hypothetical protein
MRNTYCAAMNITSRFGVVSSTVFAAIVCCWVLAYATRAFPADGLPPDPAKCHLTALVTADNDIRIDGDDRAPGNPAAIPPAVAKQLYAAATRYLAHRGPSLTNGLTCKGLFPQTYGISAPHGRELYVSDVDAADGLGFFYLVLYDPPTGAATQHPPGVSDRWTRNFGAKDPLLKTPYISFADLRGNHHHQVVFQERVHNGTMYNAVIYHYFDVGPNLALTPVLARETRLCALEGDSLYMRDLTQLSPTSLRLDTFATILKPSADRESLGYVILESSGPNTPFHVAERHPKDASSFDALVTAMDEPPTEDDFLRDENPFSY